MSKVIIRKVVESDANGLLNNIFIRNSLEEIEAQLRDSLNEMKVGRLIHLVAVYEDNIVGNIKVIKEKHILYSHRCIVKDMVVSPQLRNNGIARKLFEAGCRSSIELSCNCILATCRGDGTENFYKALGMQECGRIPKGIYEPWEDNMAYDEVILYKALL